MNSERMGKVFLVGAGPGDPGLLTRRGASLLRRADVVFFDFLTNPTLLDLAPPDAERIDASKRAGKPHTTQEWINRRLIEEAKKGHMVVRLKGGDCYLFGRGGEEAEALLEAGIAFEVVPGVTSALAAPALAGIPVTMRGLNSVLHIVAGHEDPDAPDCSVRWDLLTAPNETLVILMGGKNLEKILKKLATHGLALDTPLAMIHWGSYPRQISKRATVGEAIEDIDRVALPSPALIVIGAVARLDEGLNWFERRPLFGRRIVLTRPESSDPAALEALCDAGADAVNLPAIRLEVCDEAALEDLDRDLIGLRSEGGWLILPSPAAVRFFSNAMDRLGHDARALAGIHLAVIGKSSARELRRRIGVDVDFLPSKANAEALARELPLKAAALIAGSAQSRPELAEGLRGRGIHVTSRALYRPMPDQEGLDRLQSAILAGRVDDIVVFSPSAVRAIRQKFGDARSDKLLHVDWFAIGSTTAQELNGLGLAPAAVAEQPTPEALLHMLCAKDYARASSSTDAENRP